MRLLPRWILTPGLPASTDSESATAIEQTYKLYKTMNELISEYNTFADGINKKITDFMDEQNADMDVFCQSLRQEFQDFIDNVDLKMSNFEGKMKEEWNSFKAELESLKDSLEDDVINLETLTDKNYTLLNNVESNLKEGRLLVNVEWEQGSLDPNAGTNTNSSTRLRSKDYIYIGDYKSITIGVEPGYKYALYWYDANNNLVSVKNNKNWITDASMIYNSWGLAVKLRILVANSSDGTTSVEFAEQLTATFQLDSYYDELSYKTRLSELYNLSEGIEEYKLSDVRWTNEIQDTANGSLYLNYSNTRMSHLIELDEYTNKIRVEYDNTTYKIGCYYFDKDNNKLGSDLWIQSGTQYTFNCRKYADTKYVTICVARIDGATINATNSSRYGITITKINQSDNTIPAYFKEQIENVISDVESNMLSVGTNGETFVFISDPHWQANSKNSYKLIKKITDQLSIHNIMQAGDIVNEETRAGAIETLKDFTSKFRVCGEVYSIIGNHDTNEIGTSSTEYLTQSEVYSLAQKHLDYKVKFGGTGYYYFDNPTTRTRYICLNTYKGGNDEEQLNWLHYIVSNTPDTYMILVFAHMPFNTTDWTGNVASKLKITSFMSDVCTICDMQNESGGLGAAKVVAIFGGHAHVDYSNTSTGGIPIILIDSDSTRTYSSTGATAGTITEQCFDVVTIDYQNRIIKCKRVGRGSDREFNY